MEEPLKKKFDWQKLGGWILASVLSIVFLWNIFSGEFKKWKVRLMQQGAQAQQQQLNKFIIDQLQNTGALRIVVNGNDGKTQEIILRPVIPEQPAQLNLSTVSTTP